MSSNTLTFKDKFNYNCYIENQRAFERHKKQLDQIYSKLDQKSSDIFGITNNISYKLLIDKIKLKETISEFYSNVEKQNITKTNNKIGIKMKEIENRKNLLTINENKIDIQQNERRNRLDLFRTYDFKELQKANETIGKRLEKNSNSTLSSKKFETEYLMTKSYRKLYKQFELPELKTKIPKIVGHEFDSSMYNRVKKHNKSRCKELNILITKQIIISLLRKMILFSILSLIKWRIPQVRIFLKRI